MLLLLVQRNVIPTECMKQIQYLKILSFVHHNITFVIGWALLAVWAHLDPCLHCLQTLQECELQEVLVLLPDTLLLWEPGHELSIIKSH